MKYFILNRENHTDTRDGKFMSYNLIYEFQSPEILHKKIIPKNWKLRHKNTSSSLKLDLE